MAAGLLNRCNFNPSGSGTADFVVASAVTGFMTPAQAGAVNNGIYPYYAQSADLTQWEVGVGTYIVGSLTLQRTTVSYSTNSNALVNFSTVPTVAVDARAEEFIGARAALHAMCGGI